ncbi:MAG: hypothetical protein HY769_10325, partial [Candidatus Stahlbacteria bacterium]|nr:hypothetical protein [Candidatus Stahlbacteria bacterium]
MIEFLRNPIGLVLVSILGALIVAWVVWWLAGMRYPHREEYNKWKPIEEKLKKIGAYLDGLPELAKTNPIRKGF